MIWNCPLQFVLASWCLVSPQVLSPSCLFFLQLLCCYSFLWRLPLSLNCQLVQLWNSDQDDKNRFHLFLLAHDFRFCEPSKDGPGLTSILSHTTAQPRLLSSACLVF
uniref:Uncharacterized protein n=1 Tax=Arundo donax TaxID=35708 RepID=A0A0A9GRQ0_ARUDO